VKYQPTHLNVFRIHFPITAIVSILHRISGIVIFLLIPFLLWMLQESLASQARFLQMKHSMSGIGGQALLWLWLAGLGCHGVMGIRHLLMDIRLGDSRRSSQISAWGAILFVLFILLLSGYWIG